MTGYLTIAGLAWVAGWLYGRLQSQRIEDGLRFDVEELKSRVQALKRRLPEAGAE